MAATKADSADPEKVAAFRDFCRRTGRTPYLLSSQTGEGIPEILNALDLLLAGEALLAPDDGARPGR